MRRLFSFREGPQGLCLARWTWIAYAVLAVHWPVRVADAQPQLFPAANQPHDSRAVEGNRPATATDVASQSQSSSAVQPEKNSPPADATTDAKQAPQREAPVRPYRPMLDDVRPSSFQNLTPGHSTASDVTAALGNPSSQREDGQDTVQSYRVGPFPSVDVAVRDGLVVAIVVHLPAPVPLDQIEKELGLHEFTPVTMRNEVGEPLGAVYPERGVMLTLASSDAASRVLQLVLEAITAESFLRRAESDATHQWEKQLEDLRYASRIDPTNGDAHWRQSEIHMATGHFSDALAAIESAIKVDSESPVYRITRAMALADMGRSRDAAEELQSLFKRKNLPAYVKAFAYNEVASLMATPPEQDYAQALKRRLTAVQLATPLASEEHVVMRRQARLLLVHAYLDIAHDIAAGNWRDKPPAMNKWLRGATEICDAMIQQDGADENLRFLVARESLATHANVEEASRDVRADAAIELGERLVDQATDPLFKRGLRRELAKLYFDAARLSLSQGSSDRARELAVRSAGVIEEVFDSSQLSPPQEAWMGRLYFYLGSACAVQDENHREAVRWYERALPLLTRTAPTSPRRQLGEHGERLVSMGVSYWEAGSRNEGMRLTKDGLDAMLDAHQAGHLERRSLTIPYSNLASMYKLVGKEAEARKMSVLAAKMEETESADRN